MRDNGSAVAKAMADYRKQIEAAVAEGPQLIRDFADRSWRDLVRRARNDGEADWAVTDRLLAADEPATKALLALSLHGGARTPQEAADALAADGRLGGSADAEVLRQAKWWLVKWGAAV